MLPGCRRHDAFEAEFAALRAIGPEADRATAADRRQQTGAIGIGVHHRRALPRQQYVEQARLGREIDVHRRVIVEMLVRQVGEGCRRQFQAVETMLVETMAGGLDRQMRDATVRQRRQICVQPHRVGRGEARPAIERRRDDAERAHAGGPLAKLRPDLAEEMHGRGLAVGAGDGGDRARLGVGEGRGHQREAPPRIGVAHDRYGRIQRGQLRLGRRQDGKWRPAPRRRQRSVRRPRASLQVPRTGSRV